MDWSKERLSLTMRNSTILSMVFEIRYSLTWALFGDIIHKLMTFVCFHHKNRKQILSKS